MPQVNDQGAGSLALTPCRNVVKPTTSAAYVSFLFRCYSKPDERDELIYRVAEMISDAVQGPAIHVSDLAEDIVDLVQGAA